MATAKAKKKGKRAEEIKELFSAKAAKKAERELRNYVMELVDKADERVEYVEAILKVNDESIREIIGWMVVELEKMHGDPVIRFKGATYNAVGSDSEILRSLQRKNFAWIAMRCLVACAEWDIQIGNFKLPSDKCARCAASVRKAVKKKARKKNCA